MYFYLKLLFIFLKFSKSLMHRFPWTFFWPGPDSHSTAFAVQVSPLCHRPQEQNADVWRPQCGWEVLRGPVRVLLPNWGPDSHLNRAPRWMWFACSKKLLWFINSAPLITHPGVHRMKFLITEWPKIALESFRQKNAFLAMVGTWNCKKKTVFWVNCPQPLAISFSRGRS